MSTIHTIFLTVITRGVFCICLLLISLSLYCQKGADRVTAEIFFNEGITLLLDGKTKRAARSFKKAITMDSSYLVAHRFLGASNELIGNYGAAIQAYEYVLARNAFHSRLLYYQTGMSYYKISRPTEALQYLNRFKELQTTDINKFGINGQEERKEELKILKRLESDLRAVSITRDSSQFINITQVVNVGAPVNSKNHDYFPFLSNDMNTIIFNRRNSDFGDENLLMAQRRDEGSGYIVSRFSEVNTRRPEGMCTLVRDGKQIYLTQCDDRWESIDCDIFEGILDNNRIKKVIPLTDQVNSPHWESQSAVSCDGQYLLFAANRPGGIGGTDIYICERQSDGQWSRPRNLGAGVNTPQNEEAPFLSNDGKTLYFSSSGHYSLGDQDIFMSWYDAENDYWTRAVNLGPPVNGPHRELGFHLNSNGSIGYFASNRPGGMGGLDIYSFELAKGLSGNPITYLTVYVIDSLTGNPIVNQRVDINNQRNRMTDDEGRIFICAPANKGMTFTVNHPDFIPYNMTIMVPLHNNKEPYRLSILLQKSIVTPIDTLEDTPPTEKIQYKSIIKKEEREIYFPFDNAVLDEVQRQNIASLAKLLIGKHELDVSVTGFADDIGQYDYNLELSQKRAKAVGVFLQTAGIKANRISIEGLGEISGKSPRAKKRKVRIRARWKVLKPIKE